MTKYVSLVDRRIATLKGVTLTFQAGVPLEVPEKVVEDVVAAGLAREDQFKAVASTASTNGFDQAIFEAAVREVVDAKNPKELTKAGNPKASVVAGITGFPVSAIQIVNFLK